MHGWGVWIKDSFGSKQHTQHQGRGPGVMIVDECRARSGGEGGGGGFSDARGRAMAPRLVWGASAWGMVNVLHDCFGQHSTAQSSTTKHRAAQRCEIRRVDLADIQHSATECSKAAWSAEQGRAGVCSKAVCVWGGVHWCAADDQWHAAQQRAPQ